MRQHALNLQSSISCTAATEVSISTITLPAGDNWKIQAIALTCVCATQVEGNLELRMRCNSGDVSPNPSPFKIPIPSFTAQQTTPAVAHSLQPFVVRTNFRAAGKSILEFFIFNRGATATYYYSVSIIIADQNIDMPSAIVYSDSSSANVTATTETSLGTITISESAKKLTGVCCFGIPNASAFAASKTLSGKLRLDSNDVLLTPFDVPMTAFSGSSTAPNITVPTIPFWYPLDVPVPGGARITGYVTEQIAVDADITFWIAYQ